MMMTGAPIKLTQADAADVADLYNRCSDYFLLQDGAAPTLDDARELFSDVPPEKSAHNQAVLGWKGPGGLYGVGTQNGPRYTLRFCRAFDGAHLAKRSERGGWRIGIGPEVIAGEIDMLPTER